MLRINHDIYLIERTKLLEGILCQTILFTNALSKNYDTNNPLPIEAFTLQGYINPVLTDDGWTNPFSQTQMNSAKNSLQQTEIFKDKTGIVSVLSTKPETTPFSSILQEFGGKFINDPNFQATGIQATDNITGQLTINVNGTDYNWETYKDTGANISLQGNNTLKLLFWIYFNSGAARLVTMRIEITCLVYGAENRLPLKPYSITDCVCRVLELCQPLLMGDLPKYTFQGVTYTYGENNNLVRTIAPGSQADKYSKIIAANFSMSQCTLREQLRIIGGFIHGQPRLGYRTSPIDVEENVIYFEEYGKEEETNLADKGYIYKGQAQSINGYCTSVTTNATNLVNSLNYAQGVTIEPNANRGVTLRTESVNIMLTESNAIVPTQYPVYSVHKIECALLDSNGVDYVIPYTDITAYLFEQHEYNSTLSSYGGTYPYSKSYGIYYTQGQKNINGLFFKPQASFGVTEYAITNILTAVTGQDQSSRVTNQWVNLAFRVSYIPIVNAMFSHGKMFLQEGNHDYTTIYSQGENLVELKYFGENIKGVAQRLGNVELTKTFKLPDVSYLPKAGQKMGDYIISTVSYSLNHNYVKCTVGLTKEFNALSQYVGVSSHKRISEVSEREAYSREILLKEYIIIGDEQEDTAVLFQEGYRTELIRQFMGEKAPGERSMPISVCIAAGMPKKYNVYSYYNGIALPVVSSAFGNVMLFSWSYKDNYAAIQSKNTITNLNGTSNWVQDVPYCDYYGRMYWYDFALMKRLPDGNDDTNGLKFANGATARGGVFSYPHTADEKLTAIRTSTRDIKHPYLMRKDSREAPMCNYGLEALSNRKDLVIGSAFASRCSLVTYEEDTPIYVYFFNGKKFNKYDKAISYEESNLAYQSEATIYGTKAVNIELPPYEFTSWCIAYEPTEEETKYSDEDGNEETVTTTIGGDIVLSCNNGSDYYTAKGITQERIFINLTRTNLKEV